MAKRKTVSVEFVKDKVNHYLQHSDDDKTEARTAVASLLEVVLHETGNYRGFCYVWPDGTSVSYKTIMADGDYDETRRRYFYF